MLSARPERETHLHLHLFYDLRPHRPRRAFGLQRGERGLRANLIDLTGKTFGRLTVLQRHHENAAGGQPRWLCRCSCGNTTVAWGSRLRIGMKKTCGCVNPRFDDLTGRVFGRLTVESQAGIRSHSAIWNCVCSCGNSVVVDGGSLKSGGTSSCGCFRRDANRAKWTKHGHSPESGNSPTYRSWAGLVARCTNPNHHDWRYYGGRGITVCDRWRDFSNFLSDMGEKPENKNSIDRINNDGNYEPGNCRWATQLEQVRNSRRCKKI